jgi:hypothetical protein
VKIGAQVPQGEKLAQRRVIAFLARYLEPQVVRFVAVAIIIASLVLLAASCLTSRGGAVSLGGQAGGDYITFHVAGTILREHAPERLYDFRLQYAIYHSILPGVPAERALPYVNPPFFALPFVPLSHLPYVASYLAWLAAGAALSIAALVALGRTLRATPGQDFLPAILLALSFEPFIIEAWIGGNSSAVALFSVSLSLALERSGRQVASGAALGICLYKPTLLVIIVPLLLVARRFRTLAGLAGMGLLLAGVSVATVGWSACLEYAGALRELAGAAAGEEEFFRTWKYVDLLSFLRLLLGSPTALTHTIAASIAIPGIAILAAAWWRLDRSTPEARSLLWAAALTATLILNPHVGIYDTVLVIPGLLLTADVLRGRTGGRLTPGFKAILVLVCLTPFITGHLARLVGFQAFTPVLAATVVYQMALWRRIAPSASLEEVHVNDS